MRLAGLGPAIASLCETLALCRRPSKGDEVRVRRVSGSRWPGRSKLSVGPRVRTRGAAAAAHPIRFPVTGAGPSPCRRVLFTFFLPSPTLARRAWTSSAHQGRTEPPARALRELHMSNKMIIDASHPEETRVVVLRGSRVEEVDFESASKKPLRGNIYLAKVTRVEPSLQAAFIDYGGNRHGFLAFSEIHPDYYQIPVADRQALLEEEALSQREEDEEANSERRSRRHRRPRRPGVEARVEAGETLSEPASADEPSADEPAPASNSGEDSIGTEDDGAAGPSATILSEMDAAS